MKIIDAFGKQFTDEIIGAGPIHSIEGDEGHGDYTDYVNSSCGCWECVLSAQGVVETIFFYAKPNCFLPFGIKSHMTLSGVITLLGSPSKRGDALYDESMGSVGNWLRFDLKEQCIHVEFDYEGDGVAKVTLMLPSCAP